MAEMAPLFDAYGMIPLQSGIGGSGVVADENTKLEPGSVLGVPLLHGGCGEDGCGHVH